MSDFWKQATTTLAVIVISMAGFWLMWGRDLVTRSELAAEILNAPYPWLKDRELVLATIADGSETRKLLTKAIQGNTEAITELRIVIAELRVETRHLVEERRMEKLGGP